MKTSYSILKGHWRVLNAFEMSEAQQAINVISCYTSRRLWSRQSILFWLNQCLKSNITKVDHLCTGAAYCCLLDILFPDSINLRRVKFITDQEKDFVNNFQILEQGFRKLNVDKSIPIDKLVRGKFQDNYDFIIWFRLFYNANFRRVPEGYDVELRRLNQPFIVGTVPKLKRSRTSTTIKNQNSPRTRSATQDPTLRISPSSRSD
ncbi:hypothetical protein ACLKA7_003586 [Drosophila subpalustris]